MLVLVVLSGKAALSRCCPLLGAWSPPAGRPKAEMPEQDGNPHQSGSAAFCGGQAAGAKLHWHRAIAQIIVAAGEMTDAARRP